MTRFFKAEKGTPAYDFFGEDLICQSDLTRRFGDSGKEQAHEATAEEIAEKLRPLSEWDEDLVDALCTEAGIDFMDFGSLEEAAEEASEILGVEVY